MTTTPNPTAPIGTLAHGATCVIDGSVYLISQYSTDLPHDPAGKIVAVRLSDGLVREYNGDGSVHVVAYHAVQD